MAFIFYKKALIKGIKLLLVDSILISSNPTQLNQDCSFFPLTEEVDGSPSPHPIFDKVAHLGVGQYQLC
jgi:hypothetical protein